MDRALIANLSKPQRLEAAVAFHDSLHPIPDPPEGCLQVQRNRVTNHAECLVCFKKPERENTGVGTDKLCSVETAQAEGFVERDGACVSVTLHE